jgi:hypothetical protein
MHVHARQLQCSNPYLPQGNSSALRHLLHPSLLNTFRWSAGAKAPFSLDLKFKSPTQRSSADTIATIAAAPLLDFASEYEKLMNFQRNQIFATVVAGNVCRSLMQDSYHGLNLYSNVWHWKADMQPWLPSRCP